MNTAIVREKSIIKSKLVSNWINATYLISSLWIAHQTRNEIDGLIDVVGAVFDDTSVKHVTLAFFRSVLAHEIPAAVSIGRKLGNNRRIHIFPLKNSWNIINQIAVFISAYISLAKWNETQVNKGRKLIPWRCQLIYYKTATVWTQAFIVDVQRKARFRKCLIDNNNNQLTISRTIQRTPAVFSFQLPVRQYDSLRRQLHNYV